MTDRFALVSGIVGDIPIESGEATVRYPEGPSLGHWEGHVVVSKDEAEGIVKIFLSGQNAPMIAENSQGARISGAAIFWAISRSDTGRFYVSFHGVGCPKVTE